MKNETVSLAREMFHVYDVIWIFHERWTTIVSFTGWDFARETRAMCFCDYKMTRDNRAESRIFLTSGYVSFHDEIIASPWEHDLFNPLGCLSLYTRRKRNCVYVCVCVLLVTPGFPCISEEKT